MPFSHGNRMSTLLILAILITLTIGVIGIASVANHSPSSTPAITILIGFVGLGVNQFLGMLKQELNHRQAKEAAKQIQATVKDAGAKVEQVATKVDEAVTKAEQAATKAESIVTPKIEVTLSSLEKYDLPKSKEELLFIINETACPPGDPNLK